MVYVVLGAGRSSRMGFDKVLTPINGRSSLELVLRAVGERRVIVVLPSRLSDQARRLRPGLSIRINDEAERGMAHSLRVGLTTVSWECDFSVLLSDMPSITAATLSRTEDLLFQGADVAYPVGPGGRPGHPVLFSRKMRSTVEALGDGDSLRHARDGARSVATWSYADEGAFLDLDTPEQWQAFKSSHL
jgi:molybdenum cofactor cytidylyltransferase